MGGNGNVGRDEADCRARRSYSVKPECARVRRALRSSGRRLHRSLSQGPANRFRKGQTVNTLGRGGHEVNATSTQL